VAVSQDMFKPPSGGDKVPFYRNVKVLGVLAQIIFLALVVAGLGVIVRNVVTGVDKLGLTLGYGWMDDRSGIPVTESVIPYTEDNSYGRVLLVGFLNTLKVAIVGVILATLLGIAVALMRLSQNWLLRQVATVYVETVRNIPLAIQIFFWFTIFFIPSLPSGVSAYAFFSGFLNNSGLAIPWLYATTSSRLWWPWVIGAIILAAVIYYFQRRQIIKSERPGSPWPFALLGLLVVASFGYGLTSTLAKHPEGTVLEFEAGRGRVRSFIDQNGNGEFDRRADLVVPHVPVLVTAEEETFEVIPDNRREVYRDIFSGFKFPRFKPSEYESAEVSFVNPEWNDVLSLHFSNFPSVGQIYNDRNGNGAFDAGEEFRSEEEITETATTERGYEGDLYRLQLVLTGFERRVVTTFEGSAQFPDLEGDSPKNAELLRASPLVLSSPSFPSERTQIQGGFLLTNAYISLLLALVIYTASFISEIVRGGILSVHKGQSEASKALGLSNGQTFRLVVFPQAMRVIVPPLISQYLNLTKNSSLGFFAAYNEFFKISEITSNQAGATVPVILLLIAGYLLISLTFSLILNIYNSRIQLVER
jgi:His/Glu/Gln/Arg/opine family amino acid ABC transporter permease subunit